MSMFEDYNTHKSTFQQNAKEENFITPIQFK